jgi:hypothetical protein
VRASIIGLLWPAPPPALHSSSLIYIYIEEEKQI